MGTVSTVQPYAYAAHGETRHRTWAVIGLVISMLSVATLALIGEMHVVVLACVPAVIILPLLVLLDRVEPESPSARWFALAWGFGVSALVAGLVNSTVAGVAGVGIGLDETAAFAIAAVLCAPVIEEVLKAAPLRRAFRSGLLSSPVDAVIMAGWSAVGFTVIENMQYLSSANASDELWLVFVMRCVATPFAHTLYTSCAAIGISAYARHGTRSKARLGLLAAIFLHASWNGSAVLSSTLESYVPVIATYVVHGVILLSIAIWIVKERNRERDAVARIAPLLPPDGAEVHARRGYSPRRSLLFAASLAIDLAKRQPTKYHVARAESLRLTFTSPPTPAYLLPPPAAAPSFNTPPPPFPPVAPVPTPPPPHVQEPPSAPPPLPKTWYAPPPAPESRWHDVPPPQ